MKRVLTVTILLLILLITTSLPSTKGQFSEIRIFSLGPEVAAIGSNASYNITVSGGPAEDGGRWNVTVYLTGPDVAGAEPSESEPFNEESDIGSFTVEVKMPATPQTVELVVNVTSKSTNESEIAFGERSFEIKVVRPITLGAVIKNPTNVTIEGVPVSFYVDGKFVGITVADIPAQDEKTVTYEWVIADIEAGEHLLEVTVDLNGDGKIDPENGEVITSRIFYRRYEGPDYLTPLVVSSVFLAAIIAVVLVRKKLKY